MYVTVMPVSAYMALAFVFGFIQINWWWWWWWWSALQSCTWTFMHYPLSTAGCWSFWQYPEQKKNKERKTYCYESVRRTQLWDIHSGPVRL